MAKGTGHNGPPNYLKTLFAVKSEVSPGEVVALEVRYDDDCRHWRGGACDCEPEIEMRRLNPPRKLEVRN